MSNTALGNTAAQLLAGLLGIDNVRLATLTLTDTQIKAAPTTLHFEIVPAAGGKFNVPLWAYVFTDFSAGAYTNVSTGNYLGFIAIEVNNGNGYGSEYLFNDSTAAATVNYSELFAAQDRITPFGRYTDLGKAFDEKMARSQLISDFQGNICLSFFNTAGNFTGGNAANTLKVVLAYGQITYP